MKKDKLFILPFLSVALKNCETDKNFSLHFLTVANRGMQEYLMERIQQHKDTTAGNCTARQCSPLRQKFMECYIIKPAQSLLMKHLVIGQR